MPSQPGLDTRPLPTTFVLELTQRCNNHCQYCYTPWGAESLRYPQHPSREMQTAEIKNVIAQLQAEVAPKTIGLSGGEPLMREDLPEILSFMLRRGIAPTIITNGTLLTKELAAVAASVGSLCEVTLLSHRSEVHDQMAGRRGAWNAAVDGFINMHQAGGNTIAAFVATQLNYMDLYKTAELAIALGATGLMYNRMNLGAYNLQYADRLLPTPAMIRENLEVLEALQDKYNVPIVISVVIEPCVVDVRNYPRLHFGWCPLAGERSYFTIDPVGNVRICNHSPTIVGNIHHDHFPDIYYHHPYVHRFRDVWPVECAECAPELKQMCGGGCKAVGEQCFGTLERVDPFVTRNRQPSDAL